MPSNNALRQHALLLTGVAGPCIFAISVIIVGELRADYDHIDQFISELGESGGSFSWVMNYVGFMLSGSLILTFIVTFRTLFPNGIANAAGSLFLAIFAVNLFLAGVYSCDVGCSPVDPSRDQRLHDLVSIIAFPAFILGVLIWGLAFCRQIDWRGFGVYSLVTAVISVFLLVVMVQSEATRDGTGAYQRLFLAVLFVWLMALAIRLRRDFQVDKHT